MLKASWGGGGKGIRKVQSDEDVRAVFKQIQGEVRGCLGRANAVQSLSRES
jgi:acetyl-CoA carboxylase / biotin carboxylase 1